MDKKNPTNFLTDPIFLGFISVYSYLVVFIYESAYNRFFNIPNQFISLNLSSFFIVFSSILFLLVSIFLIANLFVIILPNKLNPIRYCLIRLFYPFILVISFLKFYGPSVSFLILFLFFLYLVFEEFILPLFTQRDKKSYTEKLNNQELLENKIIALPDYFYFYLGKSNYRIVFTMLFFLLLINMAGNSKAMKKENFLTTSTVPELVILRIYGDNLICAEFNKKAKTVKNNFIIKSIKANSNLTLKLEKIGPLKVEKIH